MVVKESTLSYSFWETQHTWSSDCMVQILYTADQETACLLLPCRRHILRCASLQHSVAVRLPRTAACCSRPTSFPQLFTGRQNSWNPRGLLLCPVLHGGSCICLSPFSFSYYILPFFYTVQKKNLIICSEQVSKFHLNTIQNLTIGVNFFCDHLLVSFVINMLDWGKDIKDEKYMGSFIAWKTV